MRFFTAILLIFNLFGAPAFAGMIAGASISIVKNRSGDDAAIAARQRFYGEVYLVRGILGVFSRGLDNMGEVLNTRGIKATVINYTAWRKAAVAIVNNQKKYGRAPVVLIGHSWGANAILRMAKMLQQRNIKVRYFVTFEPNARIPVPSNINTAVNYFLSDSRLGRELAKESGSRGSLANIDMVSDEDIGHFNIEENSRLQKTIIRNVVRYIKPNKHKKSAQLVP